MSLFTKIKNLFKSKKSLADAKPIPEDAEKWSSIPEFGGKYLASTKGNIWNSTTGTIVRGTMNSRGYYVIHLTYEGKDYMRSVHRLIAEAFLGEIPDGMIVEHINNNKLDNSLSNLKITTRKGQSKVKEPRIVHRYNASVVQLDLEGNELHRYKNANQAGIATKTSSSNIIAVCKNAYGRKTANGYKWKFEEDAKLPLI